MGVVDDGFGKVDHLAELCGEGFVRPVVEKMLVREPAGPNRSVIKRWTALLGLGEGHMVIDAIPVYRQMEDSGVFDLGAPI